LWNNNEFLVSLYLRFNVLNEASKIATCYLIRVLILDMESTCAE